MARYTPGFLVSDLRGSIGRVVFDNYAGIKIVRSKPTTVTNPQTTYQSQVRTAIAYFKLIWAQMTDTQQKAWVQIIDNFPRGDKSDSKLNRGGLISVPRGPLSAWNAFIACNMNRYLSGWSVISDVLITAPATRPKPEPLKNLSATAAGLQITVSWQYITAGPKNERIEIWVKSIDGQIHPQMIYTEQVVADSSYTITQVRGIGGNLIALPKGTYQLQAQVVNEYGLTSEPSELVFIRIDGDDIFTFLPSVITLLNIPGVTADIDWTEIDLSSVIPYDAYAALVYMQIAGSGIVGNTTAYLKLRRDATQGEAMVEQANSGVSLTSDKKSGIMPVANNSTIQYAVDITGTMEPKIEIRIYGYIREG